MMKRARTAREIQHEDPKPDKPKAEPAEKPTAQPATEPEDEYTPPQVAKPSELRGWALRMGKKAKEARTEAAALQSRIKALETAPPKQLEDNSAMAQELAATKKRLESYEQDLRMTRYERSQEYREQFQKPYQDGRVEGIQGDKRASGSRNQIQKILKIRKSDAATPADFDEIYGFPLAKPRRLAKAQSSVTRSGIVMRSYDRAFREACRVVLCRRRGIQGKRKRIRESQQGHRSAAFARDDSNVQCGRGSVRQEDSRTFSATRRRQ